MGTQLLIEELLGNLPIPLKTERLILERDPHFKLNPPEDDASLGSLVYTVAGFSQFSTKMNRNRELLYGYIIERILKNYGELSIIPDDYEIKLKREPHNKFDVNAIAIEIKYQNEKITFDLGYVPSFVNLALDTLLRTKRVYNTKLMMVTKYKDTDLWCAIAKTVYKKKRNGEINVGGIWVPDNED